MAQVVSPRAGITSTASQSCLAFLDITGWCRWEVRSLMFSAAQIEVLFSLVTLRQCILGASPCCLVMSKGRRQDCPYPAELNASWQGSFLMVPWISCQEQHKSEMADHDVLPVWSRFFPVQIWCPNKPVALSHVRVDMNSLHGELWKGVYEGESSPPGRDGLETPLGQSSNACGKSNRDHQKELVLCQF